MLRDSPCSFCEAAEGETVAKVQFWDLQVSDVVKCPRCSLSQLDPKLSAEVTARGCQAYFELQNQNENLQDQQRNSWRAFRRGVAFASRLRSRGIVPRDVLEYGPGDGYFARGLQHVFPEARITCVDIVDDLLNSLRHEHGFATLKAEPGFLPEELHDCFDLVVARDVIEHVNEPKLALREAFRILRPGGYLHTLTPNGHEDLWTLRLAYRKGRAPSELLLNHVNYFDAEGYARYCESLGFKRIAVYLYNLKWFFRGRGWRDHPKLVAKLTQGRPSGATPKATVESSRPRSAVVMNSTLLRFPRLFAIYCRAKDFYCFHLPASSKVGHEIFALLQKPAKPL